MIKVITISIVKNLLKNYAMVLYVCISFCMNVGFTAKETIAWMCESFLSIVLSKSQVYEWHKKFWSGWTFVEDDPRSGCSKTSTKNDSCDWVLQIVKRDRYTFKEQLLIWRYHLGHINTEVKQNGRTVLFNLFGEVLLARVFKFWK